MSNREQLIPSNKLVNQLICQCGTINYIAAKNPLEAGCKGCSKTLIIHKPKKLLEIAENYDGTCQNCGHEGEICWECANCLDGCCQKVMCVDCELYFHYGSDNYCAPHDTYYGCESCPECHESNGDTLGHSEVPPWVNRGVSINQARAKKETNKWREVYGIRSDKIDLCTLFSDFYLMEHIANRVGLPQIVRDDEDVKYFCAEVGVMLDDMINAVEPSILGYCRMAVWGEGRYHRALGGGPGSKNRDRAWVEGVQIEEAGGPIVYRELAELFREMPDDSNVGGPRWATAAEMVYLRLSGKLNPLIFLDRVLSLQHNGGSLFNKISWATTNDMSWDLNAISFVLGNCQSATTFIAAPLFATASHTVKSKWREFIRITNKARRNNGMSPEWDQLGPFYKQLFKSNGKGYDPKALPSHYVQGTVYHWIEQNTIKNHAENLKKEWKAADIRGRENIKKRMIEWELEDQIRSAKQERLAKLMADTAEEARELAWAATLEKVAV